MGNMGIQDDKIILKEASAIHNRAQLCCYVI